MSIETSVDNDVFQIVIDRPERMNAIDAEHFTMLSDAVNECADVKSRALLIRGTGRAFCTGRDVSDINVGNERPDEVLRATFNALVMKIRSLPIPTVAAVQGNCLGAGTGIALACDLVLAADDAVFASPFGRLGAVADSGFHWFVTRRLGATRAKDLILTGRALSGAEAAECGLVSRSLPPEQLIEAAFELARSISTGPTRAFALSCDLIDHADAGATLAEILEREAVAQATVFGTDDLREGVAAFLEHRSPTFRGR